MEFASTTDIDDDIVLEDVPNSKRRRSTIQKNPNQPLNLEFPIDPKTKRRFLPMWFDSYPWLEWDSHFNAAFCYPCRQVYLNETIHSGKSDEAFISQGFINWKKATEKLKNHETFRSHCSYIVKFTDMIAGIFVIDRLVATQTPEKKVAYECLIRIITSLRYLGLPTRGHVDSESNFKQLLNLRVSDSKELQMWLHRKTTWTSVEIQEKF